MKKATNRPRFDKLSSVWCCALSLTERKAYALRDKQDGDSGTAVQARKRLQDWKEQVPFAKGAYFEQRLAIDAMTEDDLLRVLTETSESLRQRLAGKKLPDWLNYFIDAFRSKTRYDTSLLSPLDPQAKMFLQVINPLIVKGVSQIRIGIQALTRTYSDLPFNDQTIMSLIIPHLPARILAKIMKTIVLELNVARVQERLQGTTSEERFQYFLDQMMHEDGIEDFFKEYVVLARLLVEAIDLWVESELELLMRLCHDWQDIKALFLSDRDPGVLKEILVGQGDTHRRGRSVSILVWSNDFRLVYKPRSLNIDQHFQELLAWFNRLGCQPEFSVLTMLGRKTYGWVEYVQARSCTTHEEVERFYLRQGGYLAILYALAATDFHSENIVASGEYPILVDLEALFQAHIKNMKSSTALQNELPGVEAMSHSVLSVGLLPQRIWSSKQAEGIDLSGLGGHKGQLSPQPLARWTGQGTDQMQLLRERVEIVVGNHRPMLQGQEIDTMTYCDTIVQGFTMVYRLMMQHQCTFVQEILPRFATDEVRCIVRPTQVYNILLMNSFHPEVLRDALDRDRFFDRLWMPIEHQPHLTHCIKAERDDLLVGDIPLFVTTPTSLNLFSSQGEVISQFFDRSGLDVVTQRLQSMNEQDLERQKWIIRASFTTLAPESNHHVLHPTIVPDLQPQPASVSFDQLLLEARAIGDRLCALALHCDGAASWLGVTAINEREWHLLPADADLYSGTAGIAFFLAYLGFLTDEDCYTSLAKEVVTTTRALIRKQRDLNIPYSIGGFHGSGSYIYLLSHLGALWNDEALYREAEATALDLVQEIPRDRNYDVISGAAGCIAALLSLHSVRSTSAVLQIALQCGDHLLATAQSMAAGIGWCLRQEEIPLASYAHGNAGIALNLLRLFAATGEERFRQAALAALEYERSLFSPEKRNWRDLRKPLALQVVSTEKKDAYMVAWCHGASGIGLARLGAMHICYDSLIQAEIDTSLGTTLTNGFGWNHSLCHGDVGNLDILLTAAQMLPESEYPHHVQRLSSQLIGSIQSQGLITGVPQGIETPGLMVGIAGIGYGLLRLAEPERIPSVLLLAPPISG